MSWSLIQGVLPIVNRIDQETEQEARAHKGCRAIQEEEEVLILAIFYFINPDYGVIPMTPLRAIRISEILLY
jgi:hypothetical protein